MRFPPKLLNLSMDLKKNQGLFCNSSGTPDVLQEQTWAALVSLAAFETEMSFVLSDFQESIHARSEIAFSHLQRLIAADPEFREKWKTAFKDQREEACEQVGAVHLLHHGIWAFKVNAAQERTDLVFQEPIEKLMDEVRNVHGLVLTEWKRRHLRMK